VLRETHEAPAAIRERIALAAPDARRARDFDCAADDRLDDL
jgi:hypothetical protein